MFSFKQHIQEQWNENDTKRHKTIWRLEWINVIIWFSIVGMLLNPDTKHYYQTIKTLIAEWKKSIFYIKRKSFHFISSLFLTRWSIVLFFSNGIDLLSIPHYCYSKGLAYAGNIHVWNINNILNWISYKIKWQ